MRFTDANVIDEGFQDGSRYQVLARPPPSSRQFKSPPREPSAVAPANLPGGKPAIIRTGLTHRANYWSTGTTPRITPSTCCTASPASTLFTLNAGVLMLQLAGIIRLYQASSSVSAGDSAPHTTCLLRVTTSFCPLVRSPNPAAWSWTTCRRTCCYLLRLLAAAVTSHCARHSPDPGFAWSISLRIAYRGAVAG